MVPSPPPYTSPSTSDLLRFRIAQDANLPGLVITSASDSQRPMTICARIPKKREGWKADIAQVTEKQQTLPLFEVRREPLSRRIDFRDAQGVHNVMVNHGLASSRVSALEAPDGQELVWQIGAWSSSSGHLDLVSLPSNHVLARFKGEPLNGVLDILPVPILDSVLRRGERIDGKVDSEEEEEEDKARLGKVTKRVNVGIGLAALIGAAYASPYGVAALNARCGLSDELVNLGRTSLSTTVAVQDPFATNDHTLRQKANLLAARNRADVVKIDDPRPRPVPLDLVVASLVAVLCA